MIETGSQLSEKDELMFVEDFLKEQHSSTNTEQIYISTNPDIEILDSGIREDDVQSRSYFDYVRECLDLLIKYGTARYGKRKLPLLVTYLDVRTRNSSADLPLHNPYWRGQHRKCFFKPGGSDFFTDQKMLEVFDLTSEITGDPVYNEFAEDYIRCAVSMTDANGLFWWGWHRYYDVFKERKCAPNEDFHEIFNYRPCWDKIYSVNKDAATKELEGIWEHHITDKRTGKHDRHDHPHPAPGYVPCDFAMGAGEYIYSQAFLYSKTGKREHLERALLIAGYHWKSRNSDTGLIPSTPAKPESFHGFHCDTSVIGTHCYFLLKSYELTGVEEFSRYAETYLKAYAEYGFDKTTGKFWENVSVDGKKNGEGGIQEHKYWGHVDLWQPYQLGTQYPLHSAQTYVYAYQLTGNSGFLDTAEKWANWIIESPPTTGCRPGDYSWYHKHYAPLGTFAELYGRAISFFVHLYNMSHKTEYLDQAVKFADESISKLYYRGLFRGHPAKPFYGSVDGVAFLLYALFQLSKAKNQFVSENNNLNIPDDNF